MLPLEVDCQSVHQQLASGEELVLLDCREQDEWDLVHIQGADLVPMSTLAESGAKLEPWREKPIVVYCHHGGRSLQVARWLRQQGFDGVQSMRGGIDQWAAQIETDLPRY